MNVGSTSNDLPASSVPNHPSKLRAPPDGISRVQIDEAPAQRDWIMARGSRGP